MLWGRGKAKGDRGIGILPVRQMPKEVGYLSVRREPCLVLSIPAEDHERALATLVPHTTSPRGTRFEVAVKVGFLKRGVFDLQSMVNDPYAKLIRKLGSLN
jgi:mRNA interferase MazF